MAHPRMVDAYVRELLDEAFGDEVRAEGRGYILPLEAAPMVEVVPAGGNALRVLVAAKAAIDVSATPALLEALNEVNATLPYGRVFLLEDRVFVEDTVLGECVDRVLLDNAIHFVSWVVAAHGPALAEAGDGRPVTGDDDDPTASDEVTDVAGPAAGRPNAVDGLADTTAGLIATSAGGAVPADAPVAVNAAGYL
jgi:hypothetical protein